MALPFFMPRIIPYFCRSPIVIPEFSFRQHQWAMPESGAGGMKIPE